MKLSPARFSFSSESHTASCTAMFRDGIHMHIHIVTLTKLSALWNLDCASVRKGPREPEGQRGSYPEAP